jgi:hypothetical protein
MSFGGSPSDILAAIKFTARIASALKKDGGSQTKYQNARRSLESLQATLEDLQHLAQSIPNGDRLQSQVDHARSFISSFEDKIGKYEKKLGSAAHEGPNHGTLRKVDFALRAAKDLQDFRNELMPELEPIKFSLQILNSERLKDGVSNIKTELSAQKSVLEVSRVNAQAHYVDVNTRMAKLQQDVVGTSSDLQSRLDSGARSLTTALRRLHGILVTIAGRLSEMSMKMDQLFPAQTQPPYPGRVIQEEGIKATEPSLRVVGVITEKESLQDGSLTNGAHGL